VSFHEDAMTNHLTIITLLICLLAGCASIEGTYYPGCIAYEGSKIYLHDGEFVWEKFTDQVVVDDDGKVINQFPGYPKRGTYRIAGQVLQMTYDRGGSVETMHMHQHDGQNLLLTSTQVASWENNGRYDDCALTREVDDAD